MLGRIFFIARTETASFFRTRETYVWAFVMPVLFMYFIGTVTSQFGGGTGVGSKDRIVVSVPTDAGFLAEQLCVRLEQSGLAIDRDGSPGVSGDPARRLIIPANFTDSALRGEKTVVKFVRRDEGLANDFDQFRVARAVYTVLADLIVCDASGNEPSSVEFNQIHEEPRSLTLDVQSAGQRPQPPTGFAQAVPGIMIMFTMLSLLSGGTGTLVIERQQGRLKRLASTPITRSELLIGKWAGRMILGVVQIIYAMIVGTVLFGMDWGPALPMIALILFAFAALCGCLSILLGNLARSEAQAIGLGVLFTNVIAALGGLWWPIEICPRWMQLLANSLPTGWAMYAMHQLVNFRASAAVAVAPLAALAISTVIIGFFAVRTFRYQ
jgi:ABC-2 type transport system permease protein